MAEHIDKVAGVQGYMTLDLWTALGLDTSLFDDYMQRNKFASTWAALIDRVRVLAMLSEPCLVNDYCVLHGGHFGPCCGHDDVGTSEPPRHATED